MNRASSWSTKETDFNVRGAAQTAARRAGLSLQDWLDETWRIHAADSRVSVTDLNDDERAYAVARRLTRLRAATEGSRRADTYADRIANRKSEAREPDDRVWRRITTAVAELEDVNPVDPRAEESLEVVSRRPHRERVSARPSIARARFSIDEAIDDIAERQNELDSPQRPLVSSSRHDNPAYPPLKIELAKVTKALAELQRETVESASAEDVETLRREVAQISRGLTTLAPRDSIEHIESAIGDLSRRLSEARTSGLVEEFLAPVELLVGDLKRSVLGAAPTAALEAIEKRIGALVRNVDALAEARIDPDAVEALLEHSRDIREMLEAATAKRPEFQALEKRIGDLGARLDRIAERGATSAGLDAIVNSVTQIRADLETQNPIKAVKALDGRMDALARKLDQAASRTDIDAHFDRLGKRLDVMHSDLAERAPDNRKLEEMIAALQARTEQARPAVGSAEMRELVGQLMAKIDQAVGAGAEPAYVSALEDQISRVAARLDLAAPTPNVQQIDLARIESSLASISERLDNPLPITAADQVQETVRLLIERFDSTLRSGVTGETLVAIERRLADVAQKLEAPVTAELDTARLESLVHDLASRIEDPSASTSDVRDIKLALAQIADRMDAALRGDSDQSAMRGLEDQIAALSQRMEKASDANLAKLERTLDDIQDQMEQLRSESNSAVPHSLEREIADLRSLHSVSDKRTHATLNAVHETLEKVVDRLAMLEDEIDQAPKASAPVAVSKASLPSASMPGYRETENYKPSVELNFGPPQFSEQPAPEPAPVASPMPAAPKASAPAAEAQRAAPPVVAERAASDAVRRHPQAPTAAKISGPAFEDFLLEPGSGKPSPRDVVATALTQQPSASASNSLPPASVSAMDAALDAPLQPEGAEAAPELADAQANFIAAVRRAQQSVGGAREGGTTGNQLLDEARARARAAAAEAEAQQTKKPGGGFGLKALFSGRKRSTTAAGLTGLVVVLGALQGASMFYQTEKARSARTAENTAPTSAQQPEKRAARAESPQLGAVSPPPDRFAQTAPLADMTPVASVPVNSSARGIAPASPRDPFKLAAAGDVHAQYELGVRFAEGRNGPRDQAKAIEWLTKAADQNFPPAQYRLGVVYEKGIGAPRDSERARALYVVAAESGNVKAMHNLGALLADGGADGKPDYAAAARWFKRAAEHGVRDSQYNLAILSARGLGVPQDLVESYVWFLAASTQGDADAGAKLKEVAGRLDAAQLARAQATAKAQRAKPLIPAANEPLDPEGGWATAPEQSPAKPTASRAPKFSSLQTR
ncbi:MAG: hypothetical protein Q8M31_08130 [Beijerinckiaceae bacterium]|nr:hypothetical protein [Beijerinckiaceae bacterium]